LKAASQAVVIAETTPFGVGLKNLADVILNGARLELRFLELIRTQS